MFTSKKILKSEAFPTLFNIPNPPPKVGAKRRLLVREEPPQKHSKENKANMI
jgi:hypothetical protein